MSKDNGLDLAGAGAAYIRVSGDRQEVERQLASVTAFEQRHQTKIAKHHRYEDYMPRDLSERRPDFQRMLTEVKTGTLRWIVVDQIDRFGFCRRMGVGGADTRPPTGGLQALRHHKDDEWTSSGLMSFFKAGLAGHSSHDEQMKKSSRSLGGMIIKARSGEWMGGPPKLGFDVGCFDRTTGDEIWRVVWEGLQATWSALRSGRAKSGRPTTSGA